MRLTLKKLTSKRRTPKRLTRIGGCERVGEGIARDKYVSKTLIRLLYKTCVYNPNNIFLYTWNEEESDRQRTVRMGCEKHHNINEQEDGASGFYPTNYQNGFYDISNGSWIFIDKI